MPRGRRAPSRERRRARGRIPSAPPAARGRRRRRPGRSSPRAARHSPRARGRGRRSTSTATTSPASIVALPPGAAQRSSTRSPATAPTARPASWEPALCGHTRPSANAVSSTCSTCQAPGTSGSGSPSISPRTSRTTVAGATFWARISASAPSAPRSRHHVSATQSGYECATAASSHVESGRASTPLRPSSARRRRTAFANGTARSSPARRTSSTDSLTAA